MVGSRWGELTSFRQKQRERQWQARERARLLEAQTRHVVRPRRFHCVLSPALPIVPGVNGELVEEDRHDKFGRQLIQLVLDRWAGAGNDAAAEARDAVWRWAANTSSDAPMLSDDAWALLREAAKDKHGTILRTWTMSGLSVGTNGREFVEDRQNPRVEVRWESVVRELADEGLIQDRGHKNEVFAVTDKGYAAVESASP
jgi:hypothetical protein